MFGLEHLSATTAKGRFVFLVMVMVVVTAVALLEGAVLGSAVPLVAAMFGWAVILMYGVVEGALFERAGRGVAAITLPSGSATPSVNQHSNIEALVARGRLAEAADAYRAVIAADPRDLVACERLGQLALRELKDPQLALFAAREGEKRAPEPGLPAGIGRPLLAGRPGSRCSWRTSAATTSRTTAGPWWSCGGSWPATPTSPTPAASARRSRS